MPFAANVDPGTCAGKSELKDGESCTVACNATLSTPPSGGAVNDYTYACNDTTGSGLLSVPSYICNDSM